MKNSFSAVAILAAALSSSVFAMARADEVTPPTQQSAQLPTQAPPGGAALQDYRANINPNTNPATTGAYDDADRFKGPTGRPLPGWGSVNGEGAGDF